MEPGSIAAQFYVPQRRIVFASNQEGCLFVRNKRDVLLHAVEFGGPIRKTDFCLAIIVTVQARDIDGLALMISAGRSPHQPDARMAIDTSHTGQVMHIGGILFDLATIRQAKSRSLARPAGTVELGQARVTQRYATRTRVTAKTPRIRDVSRQSRVGIIRIVIDMACKATTAAVSHDVQAVRCLALPQVTTRT